MKMRWTILGLCLIGLSREAHVSEFVYEDEPLSEAVKRSRNIVEATFLKNGNPFDGYEVTEVLFGTELKVKEKIQVSSHGTKRLETLKEGKSPIFRRYRPQGLTRDAQKQGDRLVLFLSQKRPNGSYEFAIWPGYTGLIDSPAVRKALMETPQ